MPALVAGIHVLLSGARRQRKTWMAGTTPGFNPGAAMRPDACRRAASKQCLIQILPFRVHAVNETNLPGVRPVFDSLFPLDRSSNVIVVLVIHKHLQAVPFREPVNETFSVLVSTARQIAGNPDVKRAIAPVRHEIYPACHGSLLHLSADNRNSGSLDDRDNPPDLIRGGHDDSSLCPRSSRAPTSCWPGAEERRGCPRQAQA